MENWKGSTVVREHQDTLHHGLLPTIQQGGGASTAAT